MKTVGLEVPLPYSTDDLVDNEDDVPDEEHFSFLIEVVERHYHESVRRYHEFIFTIMRTEVRVYLSSHFGTGLESLISAFNDFHFTYYCHFGSHFIACLERVVHEDVIDLTCGVLGGVGSIWWLPTL